MPKRSVSLSPLNELDAEEVGELGSLEPTNSKSLGARSP
jgi:hypothetical protein